ncbi:hypothetical protein K490DRAFT_68088 [Saccharata proteae CBS 121410]|uniref:Intermediate filament protein-like protein n=1 Tax=Saccharata proteae CBS 121410 TaxID=1314787 RepID=A0A9P4LT49_9PEZI|nr:hypothetical protein K490DRAFT_68088 [Saccharata proteae CBS 121410]
MELSRRDVILAAIAVFIAWGFVTHWIPSVRYLPYAFLAGIAVAFAGLGYLILSTSRGTHYGRSKTRRAKRNVAFVAPGAWEKETAALKRRSTYHREPLYPPSFLVSDHLDGLLDLILRDFVTSWYANISPRPNFQNEVDRAIRAALVNIRDKVLAVDIVEVVILRIVPLITQHMRDFDEAERVVRGKKLSRNVTETEELDMAIAGRYRDGKLHPAASLAFSNTKLVQQQHLRGIVARLVAQVLPRNMQTSSAVNALIKEIVACAVLFPVVQMLSDPDTWNQLLEAYGRTLLQDRKTVRKLRAALDEHAPPSPKITSRTAFPRLAPQDSERRYERFIRAIRQCNSLSDARRFRSEVLSQLRKDATVEGQDPLYLRRLEMGKRILDQRVAQLSTAGGAKPKLAIQPSGQLQRTNSRLEEASLRHVLYDASGLSYFMEFMDRQGFMRLVQYWVVVDGFRNPLEEDTDEPEGAAPSWGSSERADLAQIYEAYLTKPELHVSEEARLAVDRFLKAGKAATSAQYVAARRAVLHTQSSVYAQMQEHHFPKFKRSDLWYKWLASDESSSIARSPVRSFSENIEVSVPPVPARTPALSRTLSSKTTLAAPDLRRAAVSSSDLKKAKTFDVAPPLRRSLDESGGRRPLFDDDLDADPLARSTLSFDSEAESVRPNGDDSKIVDAMSEALNDILDDDHDNHSLFSDTAPRSAQDNDSLRGSIDIPRSASPMLFKQKEKEKERPSIASLGLVGAPTTRGVFEDNLFGEEQKFLEDEIEDSDANDRTDEDEIHEAAPGDLGLAEAIDSLTQEIDKLVHQDSIVDSLTRKAELTNNAAELRILRKSKASLQRELHRKELQRQQYIIQESDNSLYGRATVTIKSIMVGTEEDGREFAMYVIEVRRQAGEQMSAAQWVIARRYSEFHDLNKRLRARYPMVRNLDFPGRQMVLKLQKDFLQKRRIALERYLRELLLIPAICRSRELRAFLSQQAISDPSNPNPTDSRDFVTRIYNSLTDGMEEFMGNIPVLDQLSLAGQNLISAATSQMSASNGSLPSSTSTATSAIANDAATAAEAEAELRAFDARDAQIAPFIKPICDLFLEAFELNRESNWLRGRAVVVVLHQLLGGTIERKVRDTVKAHTTPDTIAAYIEKMKATMWPDGKMRVAGEPRTEADKAKSKKEAGVLLAMLVPEVAGSVVGRANAAAAARRIAAVLNNGRLK